MPSVLISDKLSPTAVDVFKDRGLDITYEPALGKDRDRLLEMIPAFDGLAVRSSSKATAKLIAAAPRLKVIGRAGIGVDNIDIPAATAAGIVVMNTPYGNAITTAEHTIAMMFALARQIPAANASTHAGKWEKSRFMGVELYQKNLGLIGCGNIGAIVANRARALQMKVMAFDPFLTPERAIDTGVEKVELDQLLARADFITLHTPLTDQTRDILSRANLARTRPGVRLINCARGGLVDEQALKDGLDSGHIAGAALDVFAEEPATSHPLFGHPDVVATPHLGASTSEAQENVAIQVAEQMADFLLTGAVANALNMPSVSAEEAPKLKPFINLVDKLGAFAGQLTKDSIEEIEVIFAGSVATLNIKPLTAAAIAGVLRPMLQGVNVVNAPAIAKERGILVTETVRDTARNYDSTVTVKVATQRLTRTICGTTFGGEPRVVEIKGIAMEASLADNMLYVTNDDRPGFIGNLGGIISDYGLNIARFNLGRDHEGGSAIALIGIDGELPDTLIEKVRKLDNVLNVSRLQFQS